jgi:hypothetical protein
MQRYLLAGTAAVALAAPAVAETISTATTQPVKTSTIKNGTADAITISATGSVKPAGGTAVTMDSNHAVTNQGAIGASNANGAIGILATAGTSAAIANSGTIAIDETYAPTDADKDGDLEGPFATGSNRFGIRTAGAHAGNLVNAGTITVEGNDSAGISVGGPLTGNLTHDGTTKVVGDRAIGVYAGAVTGDIRLAGQVSAQGQGAMAVQFAGDVTGTMVIQGTVASTGYRSTTAPSATASLDADDLLQGGPAVLIEGNVTGGIRLAIAPKDNSATDKDEDKDGIEDAKEGNAAVTSYGAAPAVAIGATDRDIVIGPAGSATTHGLVVEGSISGQGVYAGVNATGLAIGGRGGVVTIANGIALTGSVEAASNGASATAVLLGSGANLAEVRNAGTISATGGNAASAKTTAVLIDTGATVPAIRNSGAIKAVAAGADGSATAILDRTGGLTLIENSGAISASGAAATRNVAIDLSANTSGATIRQTTGATSSIVGRVLFGSSNDVFDVSAGAVTGEVSFGAGDNTYNLAGGAVHLGKVTFGAGTDVLGIAGSAKFLGDADFGGGAGTLTLAGTSLFSGALLNAGGVAVTVNGGMLHATNQASLGSLSVGASGTLLATLDSTAGEGTRYTVAGAASFASGATLSLILGDIDDAVGRHTVLQAGSISGLSTLKTNTALMPFIFKATLATDAPANTIAVDVSRKTVQELDLNHSQGAAFDAIFAALAKDEDVEDVFLEIRDGDRLRGTLGQMLPDHAGGAFEGISRGVRTFARQVADAGSPVYTLGGIDVLVSAAGWSGSKDQGQTASYDLGGFGFSAAGEIDTGVGAFGVSASVLWNDYDQGSQLTNVESDTYELAAYWRGQWDGLSLFARGSLGTVGFEGRRTFLGTANGETVSKEVNGEWDGTLTTLGGGVSYEMRSGSAFLRPAVSVDYIKLDEDGYSETGGGDALDLAVDERKSDEFAGSAGLAVGLDFLGRGGGGSLIYGGPANRWFRVEAEGGWRETLGGSIGSTTARFRGGASFTLAADQAESGWYARMRAVGGGSMFELGGEVGAEQRNGETGLSMRGTVRVGF